MIHLWIWNFAVLKLPNASDDVCYTGETLAVTISPKINSPPPPLVEMSNSGQRSNEL